MKFTHKYKILPLIIVLFSTMLITNCSDKWNEHYDEGSFNLPTVTLTEYIQKNSELSIFLQMLQITGYDSIINSSQSYTVWAPTNAALANVDLSNVELVTRIVRNHITRSRITTSGILSKAIRMLNGKYVYFTQEGSTFKFGGKNIVTSNVPTKNGLLYILDEYVPYTNNLWEYIAQTENLDSLSNYLKSQAIKVFDPANSVEIGRDAEGKVIYDSVFTMSNRVLENIGAIATEDSIYTGIIPNNTAWTEAYSRIERYYNFPENAGGATRKRDESRYTLVKDMIFNNKVKEPQSLDSIVSTSGTVFHNPGEIFANTTSAELSNGIANVTSQMPYTAANSWFKEIRVEAEDQTGRTSANNILYTRNNYGTGMDVSGSKYILVDPTTSGTNVEFAIPNTLSAKYNIYCVFVPASISDPNDLVPTKVKFKLTYIRNASGGTFILPITPTINTTSPTGITKMFVTQYNFQYANVQNDEYNRVVVKLNVTSNVSADEIQSGQYNRTMRIDCIILEPVVE